MNRIAECLNDEQIDSLLQGNLTPPEGALLEEHLEACEQCRTRVEETIGPGPWWTELENVLRDSHIDRQSSPGNGDTKDVSTSRLLDLLGPTDDPDMLGRIGPYEIVGLLGSGGMGAVFKGFDRSLHRFVAIKMMLPHLASSAAARKRFAREAQAVAAVVDDHVMAIHCVDEWQGMPYLVMTYSRGVTLQKRLSDNGPLDLHEILRIGMQAAKGLAAAHSQGIVHRDIKPANIFLDQNVERVQLMDFGLARALDDATLTRSGTLAGTPQFMSPEQARGETVDHRSDLFSLGSVLYVMCTGRAPFRAESSYGILRLITDKEPRAIRELRPELPDWLCAIIGRLMAKRPEDRYSSAAEASQLLEACLAHVQHPTASPLPDALRRTSLNRSGRPLVGKLLAVAACASLLLLAGVLVVIELGKGTLSIESEVDDIAIRITQSDETVDKLTVSKSGKSMRVAAGPYRIELAADVEGVLVENNQIELTRGGKSVVKIVKRDSAGIRPAAIEPSAHEKVVTRESPSADSLATTVERFNEELRRRLVDHDQPPLTKDELVACASWNLQVDDLAAPVRSLLVALAQRHELPEGWTLVGDYVDLPPAETPVKAFRISLQNSGSGERFTVRERCIAPLTGLPKGDSLKEPQGDNPLSTAIKRFNIRYSRVDGKQPPPLQEEEVIAAILRVSPHRDQHDVSDALFERFQDIARTRQLPEGAVIEVIPTFETEGGDIYTIWSIRMKLPQDEAGKEGWTYAFILREQFVSVKHGDAGEIHWGTPAPNGLQAGVRLSPPLKSYSIGQRVDVAIFYRNVLTKPLQATMPNVPDYSLEANDASGKRVAVVAPDMKVIAGAQQLHLGDEPTSCRASSLLFLSDSNAADENAVIVLVEAGKPYRLRFEVSNFASDNRERLDAGEIEVAISDPVAKPADNDSAIQALIAAQQLALVFESSDAIDVARTIKVLGKQGGVEIRPGSTTFLELPQPTKEMSWHAGDAPEVIGDPGLPETFSHVWCRWEKDGKVTWRCYGNSK